MSGVRRRRFALAALAATALVAALLPACRRRAPGPAECRQAAARVLFLRDPGQLRVRAVREAYDEQVRRCLTSAWDPPLLACLERQPAQACLAAFEARRQAAGRPTPSAPTVPGRP